MTEGDSFDAGAFLDADFFCSGFVGWLFVARTPVVFDGLDFGGSALRERVLLACLDLGVEDDFDTDVRPAYFLVGFVAICFFFDCFFVPDFAVEETGCRFLDGDFCPDDLALDLVAFRWGLLRLFSSFPSALFPLSCSLISLSIAAWAAFVFFTVPRRCSPWLFPN